jgi:uncharacterized protein involved in response to NO
LASPSLGPRLIPLPDKVKRITFTDILIAVGLMLFGMATRISGDFWPKIMASHYIYGAIIWIAGVLLWSSYTLPNVLHVEAE